MNQAHDDDGIIDLRALASTRPPPGAYAMPSPFASEPPPAFTRDAEGEDEERAPARRSSARTIGLVAAAAAFVVLGCVGIGFAFRGAKPAAVHAAAAPPAPAPVVVAPPAPAIDPAPAPAATTASADDATPATEATSTKKTKGGKARAGAAKATTKSVAAPAKAAVSKSSDACNCHGDFQCNIRCAASK
jgi:hypothetical protein